MPRNMILSQTFRNLSEEGGGRREEGGNAHEPALNNRASN